MAMLDFAETMTAAVLVGLKTVVAKWRPTGPAVVRQVNVLFSALRCVVTVRKKPVSSVMMTIQLTMTVVVVTASVTTGRWFSTLLMALVEAVLWMVALPSKKRWTTVGRLPLVNHVPVTLTVTASQMLPMSPQWVIG